MILFLVSYTAKIVYICVFMTSSTSYCICDTLMYPWNVRIYVCMYVCMYMYVCIYVCMYIYICMNRSS